MSAQKPILNYLPGDPAARRWMIFRRVGGAFIAAILGMIGLASAAFGAYYGNWSLHPFDINEVPADAAGFIICGILLTLFGVRFFASAIRCKAR